MRPFAPFYGSVSIGWLSVNLSVVVRMDRSLTNRNTLQTGKSAVRSGNYHQGPQGSSFLVPRHHFWSHSGSCCHLSSHLEYRSRSCIGGWGRSLQRGRQQRPWQLGRRPAEPRGWIQPTHEPQGRQIVQTTIKSVSTYLKRKPFYVPWKPW